MGWGVFEGSQEHHAVATAAAAAATQQAPQHQIFGGTGGAGASHQNNSLKEEGAWPACQMSCPTAAATAVGQVTSSSGSSSSRSSNLLSPPASSVGSVGSTSDKKMSACRFSGPGIMAGGLAMNNTMAPNSYSLDSVQHFGGPQMMGHGKQPQQPQPHQSQQQQYYMNEVGAGQHYPGLPPAFAYGAGAGSQMATAAGMVAGHHQVVNSGYDLMTGGHSVAAAAAAARSCALPSPTIYPPTPPPSAPWVHPWFLGDTF